MTQEQAIEKTIAFVKESLKEAEGGHDWFHIHRVLMNAQLIAKTEDVDRFVVTLGALLHDIADAKFHDGDETVGPKKATEFLSALAIDKTVIDHVVKIIENISFKSSLKMANGEDKGIKFTSKELQVVQDADRLDAIGAIGIARAFNYGGFKNRVLYDPEVAVQTEMTREAYKKSEAPTINHFHEKLLLLKDKMNTVSGRLLAKKRHQYMMDYLEQFHNEWNGKA
ncbi:HD domain-containing protein [Spongiimicrobium sp. 3-5]|uniref:HD domain-containing protein n=1 Tax=Spongiimicrobium sp. 3-5 TaxID=3332596 RepID=UPI00397FD278